MFRALARNRAAVGSINRDLKIYDAAARRRGFITKDLFIQDNSLRIITSLGQRESMLRRKKCFGSPTYSRKHFVLATKLFVSY